MQQKISMMIIIRTRPVFCYRTIKNPVDFVMDMFANFQDGIK